MLTSRNLMLFRAAAICVAVMWGLVECLALCRSRLSSGIFSRVH